jgi:uncharacterized membrane protein
MEVKQLPATQGWAWIKQGYALFMKAPLLWVTLVIICFTAAMALSNIPVLGEPLLSLLTPVVLAGLMSGARAVHRGEELELAHLFSGFQHSTSSLVTLGGITLVGQYLIFGVMLMVGGGTLVGIMMSHDPVTDSNIMTQAIEGAGLAVLLGLLLFSVLMTAMQFAPMLVYFNQATPWQAMQLSLQAFIKNVAPMLMYSMTFVLLAILASLPMMLGWLVLLPIVFTSLYASYCDIFPLPVEVVPAAPNPFAPSDDQAQF